MNSVLIIGHTFPEPATTAAGSRMLQLIQLFIENNFTITFATTANASDKAVNLKELGVDTLAIQLNDASFDDCISELNPSLVLFDRFITEEQFGWRVAEICPNALRILDTEDLHFLRKAREQAVKKGLSVADASLFTETAKRELASILRCDLSILISEAEVKLLETTFSIPSELLYYLPFLVEHSSEAAAKLPAFEARSGFVTVGNMLHAPNVDSIKYLKTEIWPLIREKLPEAQLHIYGSYATQQILDFHNPKEGFLFQGWAKEVSKVMVASKVCLAPLRFGAGLKGKLLDAMRYGTPSVTTTIGAEGMYGNLPIPGRITDDPLEFAKASVALFTQKEIWLEAQQNGFSCIEKRFQKSLFSEAFIATINKLQQNVRTHREKHFIGQILQHHTLQSSKYLSKWIEAKNSTS
ncbi:glycosyltransferase involved in cell wall biosynthesis [Ulvibacter sp. MAR_2010_11]|uniref:glycosyltransferase n=1 Tax=Ulvibacter sp. MAR_2010_11 TaxID=1250229 RepID=UPI000C2C3A5F|nr:glycosyltransferase family 4 protein [Ulvibacter sp. MAR_2010_11]PKA83709.1 glycosyltransferase involved in cell wall biosynthesis [Ulvibacter sp. MAR_2010_11]